MSDELSNITKFFGDWHLARIYQGLSARFHLGDWHRTIDEKLKTLDDLYQLMQAERSTRWMFDARDGDGGALPDRRSCCWCLSLRIAGALSGFDAYLSKCGIPARMQPRSVWRFSRWLRPTSLLWTTSSCPKRWSCTTSAFDPKRERSTSSKRRFPRSLQTRWTLLARMDDKPVGFWIGF